MLTIEKIGERIKVNRESRGYNQQELVALLESAHVRMSRETLSKIENGARSVSAIEIKAICEVLNIDLTDFLKEDKEEDLVMLFRKYRKYHEVDNPAVISELNKLQDIIRDFSNQMRIKNGEVKMRVLEPLWKE